MAENQDVKKPMKKRKMTDEERLEQLDKDKAKIEAAQAKLRAKIRAKIQKEYYDTCRRLGLTLPDLDDYAEIVRFRDCSMMLPANPNDSRGLTVYQYVTESKYYQDMMNELEGKSATTDGAPGRAQ